MTLDTRIDGPFISATLPADPGLDPATPGGVPGFWHPGNAAAGRKATRMKGWFFNWFQESIRNVIVGGGITPDRTDFTQLNAAIGALIATAQGNLAGAHSQTGDTVFTATDFGWLLRLASTATADAAFTVAPATSGALGWVQNNSLHTLSVPCDGTNRFLGLTTAGPYAGAAIPTLTLPSRSVALLVGGNGFWNVLYFSLAFDVAGAAAAALASISGQLPLYSKTVTLSTTTANNSTYNLTTQAVTFPASGITGGFRIRARATLTGTASAAMQQNFQLQLTDGTNSAAGASWVVPASATGVGVSVESSFIVNNVYAPGATPTFTLKVSTLGGGGLSGQMAMTGCHLDIEVENA